MPEETPLISIEDIAENIIAPEIQSALYAAILKADQPIRYDDSGLSFLKKVALAEWERMSPMQRIYLAKNADEFLKRLGF